MKPKEGKALVSLRLPKELKAELGKEASRVGMSLNAYLLTLIHRGRKS